MAKCEGIKKYAYLCLLLAWNPPFRLQTLQSDHRAPLVDLLGLTNISVHLTDVAAKKTMALIRSLVNKTTNPVLKAPFEVCLELYNSILGDLEYAKTALTTHDYFSVKVASNSCDRPQTEWPLVIEIS